MRWIGHICQPVYGPDGGYLGQRASNRDITKRVQMEEALRHSRALLQSVLDYSPTAIYVKDTEGRFLLVNHLTAALMGLEREAIVGKTGADLFPGEDRQETLRTWRETEQQVLSTHQVVEYELSVTQAGQPVTYLTILFPIFGIDGDIYAIGGITTDITRRKQTEEALRQSEWRYRTISELVSDFVYVYQVNPDGSLTPELMTDFSTRITNLSSEEMMQDWLRFIHPDDAAFMQRNHERLLANEPITSEFRILDSSGSVCWLQSQAQPEWDEEQQRVVRIYGAAHDVTERKRAEHALTAAYDSMADLNDHLSRSRDLMRTLFDGLNDGLVLLDGTGIVQTINRTLAHWLNSLPEQLVGHHWLALCESVEPSFPGNVLLHTLHSQRAHRRRERATRSTGEVRILDMQTLPLFDPDQTVDLIVIHAIDVTEQLEFEELAIQHEKYAASSTLVATVAHEVNSPLQAIQNFLYLANHASEEKRNTYLQLVSEEIDRISSIVSQLLDIYRTEHNALQPVDITVLISRVLLLTGSMLAKNHIQVERQLDPDTPLTLGRPDQLTQVILNLVINAIDAMADGGSLRLHTGRLPDGISANGTSGSAPQTPPALDGTLVFEISDTGSGMSREVQARIFDSFFTTKSHGTGLGLAISRKIIGQHNGTITIRSSPGAGSTFAITLPVYVQPLEQRQAPADTTSSTEGEA
jgi:PAS domain S-box-containing protein